MGAIMTTAQLKILRGLAAVQERQQRYLEVLLAQQREAASRLSLLERHNGTLISHVVRLTRAKEVLLEAIGGMSLTPEQRAKLTAKVEP
jgi:hypothetical protein